MATVPHSVLGEGYIFLSHAGADTQAARQFAEILRSNGFEVWFDKDNLQPGDAWMATLEEAILRASAMIVYVGRLSIQAWVDREIRLGLVRNTHDREGFRFIPVLGEGADPEKLPPFVQQQQCVDLRDRRGAPEQIRRLIDVLRKASPQATVPAEYWLTHSPFRSLQVFGPDDSWLFFGRDTETGELLARLGRAPALAVIGNSGSGKSSLIQAGLIPALRRGRFRHSGETVDSWRIAVLRPSTSPFDYLAETLPGQLATELTVTEKAEFIAYCKRNLPAGGEALRTAIAALVNPTALAGRSTRVLLVVDQFEELFTLVPDTATRSRYIESLLAAARLDTAVPVHLVLALRADFYANCLDHPNLSSFLATNLYNVLPMKPPQLREAIESRLALSASRAEAGLIESLLADVGEEPGNLALLEHALAQLWEQSRSSGRMLSNDAYAAIGRLKGALAKYADEVYSEIGSEPDQLLVQKIFLELVQLRKGSPDTRRRVPKEALARLGSPEAVGRLIAHLANCRLLATSGQESQLPNENFIEVSHEALIREWPRLKTWIDLNRVYVPIQRRISSASENWRRNGLKPVDLLSGIRLHKAARLPKHYQNDLSPMAKIFLEESLSEDNRRSRSWESQAQTRTILIALLDLVETMVDDAEHLHPRWLGGQKVRRVKAAMRDFLREIGVFEIIHGSKFLEPLVIEFLVEWCIELVVLIKNEYGLWDHARKAVAFTDSYIPLAARQLLYPFIKIGGHARSVWRSWRRSSSSSVLGLSEVTKRGGTLAYSENVLRDLFNKNSILWMITHRQEVITSVSAAFIAVRETELYYELNGREKQKYARNLVYAALDEPNFVLRSLPASDFLVTIAIEFAVRTFNKHGVFQDMPDSRPAAAFSQESGSRLEQLWRPSPEAVLRVSKYLLARRRDELDSK